MRLYIQLPLVVCQAKSALKRSKMQELPRKGAGAWWGANVDHFFSPSTYLNAVTGLTQPTMRKVSWESHQRQAGFSGRVGESSSRESMGEFGESWGEFISATVQRPRQALSQVLDVLSDRDLSFRLGSR